MKKIAILLTIIFSFTVLSTFVSALELPITVIVNGTEINFPDAKPFIDANGRTQTPARFIGQALGATASWDEKAKKATFVLGSKKLNLYIGKKEYDLDGQKKQMDTVALIKGDRTFVPARYVAEAFGASVTWDKDTKTVYIKTNGSPTEIPGDTKNVAGFIVPKSTDLTISAAKTSTSVEVNISIDFLRGDVEKQKDDLEKILLQKFADSTVKQIMDCVRPKKLSSDTIEAKTFYDSKTTQYIYLAKSWPLDDSIIEMYIYKKGVNPEE